MALLTTFVKNHWKLLVIGLVGAIGWYQRLSALPARVDTLYSKVAIHEVEIAELKQIARGIDEKLQILIDLKTRGR